MTLVLHVEPLWVSPYVFSVFVALREKNVEFEAVPLDYTKEQTRAPAYLAKTITGRVPTLLHDDFGLGESTAIIEYLEEVFPEPSVLPTSKTDRARCRQIMSWLRSDETAAIRADRSSHTIFYGRNPTPLTADGAAAAKKLLDVAGRIIQPRKAHVFAAWSLVDSELAFMIHRLIANGDPVPSGIRSWAEGQWERPSVRAFLDIVRPQLST